MANRTGLQWPKKNPPQCLVAKDLCDDCFYFKRSVSVRGWCSYHNCRTHAHYTACDDYSVKDVEL